MSFLFFSKSTTKSSKFYLYFGIYSSIQSPEKISPSSFLDHNESRVLHFVKYHGLGNDFILVDNRDSMEPKITPQQAVRLCDRNFGIGGDGVIFAMPGTNGTDYTMRIFNSDGSEPAERGKLEWDAGSICLHPSCHRCVVMEFGALPDI